MDEFKRYKNEGGRRGYVVDDNGDIWAPAILRPDGTIKYLLDALPMLKPMFVQVYADEYEALCSLPDNEPVLPRIEEITEIINRA